MSEIFRSFSGRVIDELRLTEYLAGSANSATFKVVVSGEAAAMKLFAVDSAQAEEKLARLRLAEKLSHPHLLRLIRTGRGEVEGTSFVYIVTEFAEENLTQVLPERALTPQETSEVLRATLDALAYLHAQGLVHGDLKPANIMASGDQLKLAVDGVQRIGEPLAREPGPHDAPDGAHPTHGHAGPIGHESNWVAQFRPAGVTRLFSPAAVDWSAVLLGEPDIERTRTRPTSRLDPRA